MHIIPYEEVKKVKWKGDSISYDLALHALGRGQHDQFLVTSPDPKNENLYHYIDNFDYADEKTCIVWNYENSWVAKLFPKDWELGSYGIIELEMPVLKWERNSIIPALVTFENDPRLLFVQEPWNIGYELIWYIVDEEVWALKCHAENTLPKGVRNMGHVTPVLPTLIWERNLNIPESVTFENDPRDSINFDLWDTDYELVWHVTPAFVNNTEVWAFKCHTENMLSKGFKKVSDLTPAFPQRLDVVFISYHEFNAEENWQRVLEKAPYAKRVNGVTGIFEAHKAAAERATTDMFYVVDGDAYLVDDFDFEFQPGLYDRNCTYIWRAKNPINGLVYGYGGVKLFPTTVMQNATTWKTLDLSTTIGTKLKIIDTVSNITAFDTDELAVWRSAFRECAKLCYNITTAPTDIESQFRLDKWLTSEETSHPFAKYATDGASYAIKWVDDNKDNYDALRMINSREWIEEQFKNTYVSR
jgi:hypothetical protein